MDRLIISSSSRLEIMVRGFLILLLVKISLGSKIKIHFCLDNKYMILKKSKTTGP